MKTKDGSRPGVQEPLAAHYAREPLGPVREPTRTQYSGGGVTASGPAVRATKRFDQWFSELDEATKRAFLELVYTKARRLVGSDAADDLAQDVIVALMNSPTFYTHIPPDLAAVKAPRTGLDLLEQRARNVEVDFGSRARDASNIVDAAHDLNALAAGLGYTFESAKETLERGAAEAARGITSRSAKAPQRLKWDTDRRLPDENPASFAWRAYQAEAKAGTLHRRLWSGAPSSPSRDFRS